MCNLKCKPNRVERLVSCHLHKIYSKSLYWLPLHCLMLEVIAGKCLVDNRYLTPNTRLRFCSSFKQLNIRQTLKVKSVH